VLEECLFIYFYFSFLWNNCTLWFCFFSFSFSFLVIIVGVGIGQDGMDGMDGWMGWMDEWIGNRKEVLRFLVGICVISSFFSFLALALLCFAFLYCPCTVL